MISEIYTKGNVLGYFMPRLISISKLLLINFCKITPYIMTLT